MRRWKRVSELCGFRLHVFWAMTPRELEAALRGAFGVTRQAGPMSRADLSALIGAYPD